jgi:hypothetical protein
MFAVRPVSVETRCNLRATSVMPGRNAPQCAASAVFLCSSMTFSAIWDGTSS